MSGVVVALFVLFASVAYCFFLSSSQRSK